MSVGGSIKDVEPKGGVHNPGPPIKKPRRDTAGLACKADGSGSPAAQSGGDGVTQFLQRVVLELADAFGGNAVLVSQFLKGGLLVGQPAALEKMKRYTETGLGELPICMAKTHLSLSHDPLLAPSFRLPDFVERRLFKTQSVSLFLVGEH